VELRQLRLFVAVAEELHFGRAAAREHIAQPALSREIQRLERQLGTALFERTSRRVALTRAGRELLPRAYGLLVAAEEASRAVRRHATGDAGRVRIGFTVLPPAIVLRTLLRRLEADAPEIDVEVRTLWWSEQLNALDGGSLDLAFVGAPVRRAGVATLHLLVEPVVAVLPPGHRAAASGSVAGVRLADLAGIPIISMPRSIAPEAYDFLHGLYRTAGLEPRVLAETTQHAVTRELIVSGRAMTLVPASLAHGWTDVAICRLCEPVAEFTYLAAWRAAEASPALHRCLAVLSALVDEEFPTGSADGVGPS